MTSIEEKIKAFDDGSFDRLVEEVRKVTSDEAEFQVLLAKRVLHQLDTRTVRKQIAAEKDIGRRFFWQIQFNLVPKRKRSAMNRSDKGKVSEPVSEYPVKTPINEPQIGLQFIVTEPSLESDAKKGIEQNLDCQGKGEHMKNQGKRSGKEMILERSPIGCAANPLQISMKEWEIRSVTEASTKSSGKKGLKRKLDTQEKSQNQKKQRKNSDSGPNVPPPELPLSFRTQIEQLGGKETMLVVQKQLFKSDICPVQSRFLIPTMQMNPEFLKPEEAESLDRFYAKEEGSKDFRALIIEPSLMTSEVSLRRWAVKNKMTHFLVRGWIPIVQNNRLQVGHTVQLWSFRSEGRLCFALVVVEQGETSKGSEVSHK